MLLERLHSFLRRHLIEGRGREAPGLLQYALTVGLQGALFTLSVAIQGESEVLFSFIYLLSAIATGVRFGYGPGLLAGTLASLSVDYHYMYPDEGRPLNPFHHLLFLFVSMVVIQAAIVLVAFLRTTLLGEEQEKAKAIEAIRLREQILGIVAHDLRQPIASVKMRVDLLARKAKAQNSALVLPYAEGIQGDVRRLNRMIDDLLDFSRIDSGQLEVSVRPIEIVETVRLLVGELQQQFADRPIELNGPARLMVMADPLRFQQVLLNLLSNAGKYGDPGTPIRIELECESSGRGAVAVTNFGRGIRPDQVCRIFSRFGRTSDARESSVPGLGLGLFITKNLVEAQGGEISMISTPGRETSFRFWLPLALNPSLDCSQPIERAAPPQF